MADSLCVHLAVVYNLLRMRKLHNTVCATSAPVGKEYPAAHLLAQFCYFTCE